MKLKKTSWHYLLRTFFFRKPPPNNLCPYFWEVVLSILAFPLIILCLPSIIFSKFDKNYFNWQEHNGSSIAFWMFLLYLFCVGYYISWLFLRFPTNIIINQIILLFGFMFSMFSIITLCGLFLWIISEIQEKSKEKRYLNRTNYEEYQKKEKHPNIFVEFIKAKYKKHCPSLTWIEEEKINN